MRMLMLGMPCPTVQQAACAYSQSFLAQMSVTSTICDNQCHQSEYETAGPLPYMYRLKTIHMKGLCVIDVRHRCMTQTMYLEGFCPFAKLGDQLNLWCSATRYEELLVHQASDNTQSIMQTPLCLLKHQFVAASEEAGCGAAFVLDAHNLDHLPLAHLQQHVQQLMCVTICSTCPAQVS